LVAAGAPFDEAAFAAASAFAQWAMLLNQAIVEALFG
jgi:hypothetical protein